MSTISAKGTSVLHSRNEGRAGRSPELSVRGVGLSLLFLVAACGSGCSTSTSRSTPTLPVEPPLPSGVIAVPHALVAAALGDAARRTRVPQPRIHIVSAESVTWPDGSTGCPLPDRRYTQVLVPGYRIVLEAGGQTLNYHAAAQGPPMFCPAERVTPPATGGYAAT